MISCEDPVIDSEAWMEMPADRNLTARTYNEKTADEIVRRVCDRYYHTLAALRGKMAAIEVAP